MQSKHQWVREACSFQATCLSSFNNQTIPFTVALRAPHRDLQGVGARVTDDQRYGFDKLFFLLPLFFYWKKYKSIFLFILYIQFDWYLFGFLSVLDSSILSLVILFHLIFILNLIFIILIATYFFFILFLIEFCFKFYPLVFNFNLFLCQIWYVFFLLLFVINPYLIIFFSILSLNILWLRILIFYFFRVCFIWS
jgi:hypothetical protein